MYTPNYFKFAEMTYSYTAIKNGIENVPTWGNISNMLYLIGNVLDPVRKEYGKPITVSSGFRNKELNTLVGGVRNSQHLSGCAADLVCSDLKALYYLLAQNPYVDQLLFERSKNGSQWLHVSVNPNGTPRHQCIYNYVV